MMYIRESNEQRLVIHAPDRVHKFQAALFLVLGALPAMGILADSGSSNFGIIIPVLLFLTGIFFLFKGGKGDWLTADKLTGQVEIVLDAGMFRKTLPKLVRFNEILSFELETDRVSLRRTWGIVLHLKDGSEVQATPFVNRKKKAEEAYKAFNDFMIRS